MRTIRSAPALRRASREARARGERIGFVPTMGALHRGHLALVERARRENDRVIASIFVNPLQFGPGEDYQRYPRARRTDHALLRAGGVDLLYAPAAERLYPQGFTTRVAVPALDGVLCGRFRPGHFTGVATVVMKLLAAAEPDRLYLGSKDYQQAQILRRMVADLDLGVAVVVCPTVREADGLAMSSRNAYLTPEERRWAPALYRALREAASGIRAGRIATPAAARREVTRLLRDGPGRLQYVEVRGADGLEEMPHLRGELVLAVAYFLGKARLIDNVVVRAPGTSRPAGRARAARQAGTKGKEKS